jgi:hypothetical protein
MHLDKAMQVARFSTEKITQTYSKYERFIPAGSFGLGIVFDLLTLGRIDQLSNIIQIGIYLLLIAFLLGVEAVDLKSPITPPTFIKKVWRFRDEVTHFFLGSLLSAFTIFFLKSGTLISSFLFLAIIAGALVGNEFSGVRRYGLIMRVVLFSVCLISYGVALVPVFWGRIGVLQFLVSIIVASAIFAGLVAILPKKYFDKEWLKKQIIYPFAATAICFSLLYAIGVIPPVPLSLTHFGIYRSVERVSGDYKVTYMRPKWKFWQSGDQSFVYRDGDRVYCFFSVFSPGGFKEQIQVRWLSFSASSGWEGSDAIPVNISGGREQGFRGFAYKQVLKPGLWQVRIETNDSREIGRLSFEVTPDAGPTAQRELTEEIL